MVDFPAKHPNWNPRQLIKMHQINQPQLEQLNITLRNLLDAYDRTFRRSKKIENAIADCCERIAIELDVRVVSVEPAPPKTLAVNVKEFLKP